MKPLAHSYPSSLLRSTRFRATVDGAALDVLTHPSADHTAFECDGPVAIEIKCTERPVDVKVRPLRLGIEPRIEGNRIHFLAPGPQSLQIEVDGTHLLYVYALAPAAPIPQGPDVRVFRSGEVHEAGLIVLKDGETCWIEAGAVVRGSIRAANGSGFYIGGYGILDGSYWPEHEGRCRKSLVLDHCRDSRVEDILMLGPSSWMLVLGASEDIAIKGIRQIAGDMSSDGIDIAGSRRVRITDCCLHNGDDNIAIKAICNKSGQDDRVPLGFPDEDWDRTVEDVVVSGCMFYNTHGGSAMEIGYETITEHIRNIRFEDIDVLAVHQFGSVFGIHNGDRARVENIVWDDIRIEHHFDTLIDFRVLRSRWNIDAERGFIRNIQIRNINAMQSVHNPGYTVSIISGYDADHPVTGVTVENFVLGGKLVRNADDLDLVTRHAHGIIFHAKTPSLETPTAPRLSELATTP